MAFRSNAPEESAASTSGDIVAARQYQVLMELGRGGTAVVSVGLARGMGGFTKLVVLKTIKEEFVADRETARMFINEARVSARMNHPNVVQVYEVFRQNRLPVIVMEHLEGQSLARVLSRAFRDAHFRTDLGIAILCKVLAGLGYAHSLADYDGTPLRIVHRDVSPHNVMLTYDGQVKLVDFGIAKLESNPDETRTGVIKGKIGYMSPEQVEGEPLDQRADLFAVGVMLWETVARRRLWGARSDAEIVRCLVLDEIPSLLSVEPNVDPELAGICDRALAADPRERFPSAAEFQTALEVYLARRSVVIRQHDIGDLVCRACAELRASSALRLQAELAKFAASAPGWEDALRSFDAPPATRGARGMLSGAGLMLVSSLLTLGVAGGAYRWLGAEPVRSVANGTAALAGAPAAPTTVTLKVTIEPRDASVTLDGQRLLGTPRTISLGKSGVEHQLRAEAPGFEPVLRRLQLDSDMQLELSLRRRAPVAAAPTAPSVSPAPAALRAAAPAASDPIATSASEPALHGRSRRPAAAHEPSPGPGNASSAPPVARAAVCDPPYFIGEDGLKHYRRECL